MRLPRSHCVARGTGLWRVLVALAGLGLACAATHGDDAVLAARQTAAQALEHHDPVAAEVALRAAIARTGATDALRAALGEALFQQGDSAGAARVLSEGAFSPDSAGLGWRVRGQVALAQGNLPAAAQAFDAALKITPEDADLWVAIASLRFTGGEQALALEASDRAVTLDPRNPRALAMRGLLIREQFGMTAALPWFEAALRLHPDDPGLLDAYGSTLGDMGQYRAMLIVARKLAEVDPHNPRALLMQAVLAARAGQTGLARAILQRTGTTFRDMPAAMLLTGVLEWQAGNHDLAVGVLERLVRLQPDNAAARATLARALAAKGDWRRLVDLFAPDCAAGRGDAALAALVADGWRHLGQAGRARLVQAGSGKAVPLAAQGTLETLAAAYADDPHRAAAAVPYVRALLAARQFDAAQDVADRLRDENSGNSEANLLSGDVRMMRGDAKGALADYANGAAIRFNEAVMARMDAALRAGGRARDADAMTSRYLAQNPGDVPAMQILSAAWARDPARVAARAALQRALVARGIATSLSTGGGAKG